MTTRKQWVLLETTGDDHQSMTVVVGNSPYVDKVEALRDLNRLRATSRGTVAVKRINQKRN